MITAWTLLNVARCGARVVAAWSLGWGGVGEREGRTARTGAEDASEEQCGNQTQCKQRHVDSKSHYRVLSVRPGQWRKVKRAII